jgi:hypothetical protein
MTLAEQGRMRFFYLAKNSEKTFRLAILKASPAMLRGMNEFFFLSQHMQI